MSKTIDGIEIDKNGYAVTPKVAPDMIKKKRKGEPHVVFTGDALVAFEALPPEIQEQVLAATSRVAETQLVATVPVTRKASRNIALVGVAQMPDGSEVKWNAIVPIDVVLERGDVLEIRVKRGDK